MKSSPSWSAASAATGGRLDEDQTFRRQRSHPELAL
jgi:hypothetical protein